MLRDVCVTRLQNGVLMPVLGLGTAGLKDNVETERLLLGALDSGYFLLDTADYYGTQETLGRVLERWNPLSRVPQKSINHCPEGLNFFVCSIQEFETNFRVPHGPLITRKNSSKNVFITGKIWPKDFASEDEMMASYERFVNQVKKDPDLLLLHWPGPHVDLGFGENEQKSEGNLETRVKAWHFLEGLYNSGKVRAIGVANFMWPHLHQLLGDVKSRDKGIMPMVNQLEISPAVPIDQTLFDLCKSENIAITGYSALGSSAQYSLKNHFLQEVARDAGNIGVAKLVLRWALQKGYCMIPRTSNLDHAQENNTVFDFALDDKIIYRVDCCAEDLRVCPDPHHIV